MPLAGAFLIELDRLEDERGYFARTFCRDEFVQHGLCADIAQCNLSSNRRRGTLRGLHYQADAHAEVKLVQCLSGAILDVIVDLRPESATRFEWHVVELSADNHHALYVPQGFAHGFQTLVDDTEVFYQMSTVYHAAAARGIRWNDPALAIDWPLADPILSARDRAYPPLS
jgi:dTDP-4-dehydrorhamnose 3,5-epimerase